MTLSTTLRYIAAQYLFAAANTSDHFGAATREMFGALGVYVKQKPVRRAAAPKLPTWLAEHREVEEKSWPK